jgi:hypothetical protein
MGTYTNAAGDIGGDIQTGLAYIDMVMLQPAGTATTTGVCVVNESLPMVAADITGGVTIVTDNNQDGTWVAIGL